MHRRPPPSCTVSEWILHAEPDQSQTSINCLTSSQLWVWSTVEVNTSLEALEHTAHCNEKVFCVIWVISRSLKCQSQFLVKRNTGNEGKISLPNSSVKPPSPRYWFSYYQSTHWNDLWKFSTLFWGSVVTNQKVRQNTLFNLTPSSDNAVPWRSITQKSTDKEGF